LATLPQHPEAPPGMTVNELVWCGRSPHTRWFEPYNAIDRAIVHQAIRNCTLADLADRALAELSGGERQRAWIAMTLAQQTPVLLLDEPTAALDVGHQLDVMHLLEDLVGGHRLAIAVVIHDINLAIRFCDHLLVMDRGRVVGDCRPRQASDWSLLERVFDVRAERHSDVTDAEVLRFTRPRRASPAATAAHRSAESPPSRSPPAREPTERPAYRAPATEG
jgi:iron complex transport system ATP-binding protein